MQLPVEEIECRLRKAGVPEPQIHVTKVTEWRKSHPKKIRRKNSTTISQSVRRSLHQNARSTLTPTPFFMMRGRDHEISTITRESRVLPTNRQCPYGMLAHDFARSGISRNDARHRRHRAAQGIFKGGDTSRPFKSAVAPLKQRQNVSQRRRHHHIMGHSPAIVTTTNTRRQ